MKKLLLSCFVISSLAVNSQTVLFEDSFESYPDFATTNVGTWTLLDVDGKNTYGFTQNSSAYPGEHSPKSFIVFNPNSTNPPIQVSPTSNWTARTGDKGMVAFASNDAPWNNDWMITPQIQLQATGNNVSFWAKSCDSEYGNEIFQVLVSTTNTDPASFTLISPEGLTTPADITYHQYSYNLDAYANQNVYIAIRCVSEDQFGFMVDDFLVTAGSLSTQEIDNNTKLTIFPNPVSEVLNIRTDTKIQGVNVYDLSGRKINTKIINNEINVRHLEKGTYIIEIESSTGKTSHKFIKK